MRHFNQPSFATVLFMGSLFCGIMLWITFFHHGVSLRTVEALSDGHAILNLLGWYDGKLAYDHFDAYSTAAKWVYRRILWLDVLVLIPLYSWLGAVCWQRLYNVTRRPQSRWYRFFLWAAPVAGCANLLEDIIVFYLLDVHPEQHMALAAVSGLLTFIKSFLLVSWVFAAALIGWKPLLNKVKLLLRG